MEELTRREAPAKRARSGSSGRLAPLLFIPLLTAALAAACLKGPDDWRRVVAGRPAPPVADAALVFGCNSGRAGEMSPCLLHRMRFAVRLFKEGRFRKLVVSGGHTLPVWASEARLMGNFARAEGIPAGDLLEEGRAMTTLDNLALGAPILRALGARTVVLVSHPGHLPRIAWLAHAQGVDRAFELYYEPVR